MNLIRIDDFRESESEQLLTRFVEHLKREEKSINTIQSYVTAVKCFNDWSVNQFGRFPKRLFRENIVEFKAFMEQQKVLAKTMNLRLTGLRSFNAFLIQEDIQSEYVITKTDFKKIQPEYASPSKHEKEDVMKFIQTVLESENQRDYVLVNVLAYTGMRISEALSLHLTDINIQSREVTIRDGKGKKTRTLLINDRLARILSQYIVEIRPTYKTSDSSEFVFVSTKNSRLSRMTVNKSFRRYSEIAAIDSLTPHDLRHFFCTHALENGFDVHEVASMAGHANLHSTIRYVNPSRRKLLQKLNKL
jgi:integrase/recombinase XerD